MILEYISCDPMFGHYGLDLFHILFQVPLGVIRSQEISTHLCSLSRQKEQRICGFFLFFWSSFNKNLEINFCMQRRVKSLQHQSSKWTVARGNPFMICQPSMFDWTTAIFSTGGRSLSTTIICTNRFQQTSKPKTCFRSAQKRTTAHHSAPQRTTAPTAPTAPRSQALQGRAHGKNQRRTTRGVQWTSFDSSILTSSNHVILQLQ